MSSSEEENTPIDHTENENGEEEEEDESEEGEEEEGLSLNEDEEDDEETGDEDEEDDEENEEAPSQAGEEDGNDNNAKDKQMLPDGTKAKKQSTIEAEGGEMGFQMLAKLRNVSSTNPKPTKEPESPAEHDLIKKGLPSGMHPLKMASVHVVEEKPGGAGILDWKSHLKKTPRAPTAASPSTEGPANTGPVTPTPVTPGRWGAASGPAACTSAGSTTGAEDEGNPNIPEWKRKLLAAKRGESTPTAAGGASTAVPGIQAPKTPTGSARPLWASQSAPAGSPHQQQGQLQFKGPGRSPQMVTGQQVQVHLIQAATPSGALGGQQQQAQQQPQFIQAVPVSSSASTAAPAVAVIIPSPSPPSADLSLSKELKDDTKSDDQKDKEKEKERRDKEKESRKSRISVDEEYREQKEEREEEPLTGWSELDKKNAYKYARELALMKLRYEKEERLRRNAIKRLDTATRALTTAEREMEIAREALAGLQDHLQEKRQAKILARIAALQQALIAEFGEEALSSDSDLEVPGKARDRADKQRRRGLKKRSDPSAVPGGDRIGGGGTARKKKKKSLLDDVIDDDDDDDNSGDVGEVQQQKKAMSSTPRLPDKHAKSHKKHNSSGSGSISTERHAKNKDKEGGGGGAKRDREKKENNKKDRTKEEKKDLKERKQQHGGGSNISLHSSSKKNN